MASSGSIDTAVEELSAKLGFALKLKEEQTVAVNSLLDGKDVLGILPTGYIWQKYGLPNVCYRER